MVDTQGESWSSHLAKRLGTEIQSARRDRGVTAIKLAETMTDSLGVPKFVVLQDEHGGVHLLPRHFYEEIQQATAELKSAVEDRREYLRKLKAEMPEEKNEGDLSGLVNEIRSFGWLRQLVNRRVCRGGRRGVRRTGRPRATKLVEKVEHRHTWGRPPPSMVSRSW